MSGKTRFCKAFARLQARHNAYEGIKNKHGKKGGLAYKMPGLHEEIGNPLYEPQS